MQKQHVIFALWRKKAVKDCWISCVGSGIMSNVLGESSKTYRYKTVCFIREEGAVDAAACAFRGLVARNKNDRLMDKKGV